MWACVGNSFTKKYCNVYHDVRVVALNARQLLYRGVVTRVGSRIKTDSDTENKNVGANRTARVYLYLTRCGVPWDEKGSVLCMCALQFKRVRVREPYKHMLANFRPNGIKVEPYFQRALVLRNYPAAVLAASWPIPLLEAHLAIGQQI